MSCWCPLEALSWPPWNLEEMNEGESQTALRPPRAWAGSGTRLSGECKGEIRLGFFGPLCLFGYFLQEMGFYDLPTLEPAPFIFFRDELSAQATSIKVYISRGGSSQSPRT